MDNQDKTWNVDYSTLFDSYQQKTNKHNKHRNWHRWCVYCYWDDQHKHPILCRTRYC